VLCAEAHIGPRRGLAFGLAFGLACGVAFGGFFDYFRADGPSPLGGGYPPARFSSLVEGFS